jgi:hypothetical protein
MADYMAKTFGIMMPVYVGEVGAHFISEYRKDNVIPINFNCIEYDSNYMIAYALENAIAQGHDFEDPHTLHSDIRHTRFSGCSGPVLLE